jgi:methyl-accepting chemotaxis protein
MLSGFSLKTRMLSLATFMVILLTGVVATTWIMMGMLIKDAQQVAGVRIPQLTRVANIEIEILTASATLRHAMLAPEDAQRDANIGEVLARKAEIEKLLGEFEANVLDQTARDSYNTMKGAIAAFWKGAAPVIPLVKDRDFSAAFKYLDNTIVPLRKLVLEATRAERARQSGRITDQINKVVWEASTTRKILMVITILAGLGVFVLAWQIMRVVKALGGEPDTVRAAVLDVASGNLAVEITTAPNDHDSILAATKKMTEALRSTVRSVNSSAEGVAIASTEISLGNTDLSNRTEQQAASLQKTASAMEELNAIVLQSSERASEVDHLATQASAIASQGGTAVSAVVHSMKEIADSANQISEIVNLIDSIAFQTNILALNAAVEAARAGEQGRGFAVVAAEVRNLAQRSSDSAAKIRSLISTSVMRIEGGAKQAQDAGKTINEVVVAIEQVAQLMSAINTAGVEQRAGFGEVNEAVVMMDQTTQQNAALVEESAAAAEQLRQKAQELVATVSTFKLERSTYHQS